MIIGDSKNPIFYTHIPGAADIVLIDGCHKTVSAYTDGYNVLNGNHLSPEGIMIFHDIRMISVRRAVKALSQEFELNTLILDQYNINIGIVTLKNSVNY